MPDPACLPAWIAARVGRHDGPALTWGEPCATPGEALYAASPQEVRELADEYERAAAELESED